MIWNIYFSVWFQTVKIWLFLVNQTFPIFTGDWAFEDSPNIAWGPNFDECQILICFINGYLQSLHLSFMGTLFKIISVHLCTENLKNTCMSAGWDGMCCFISYWNRLVQLYWVLHLLSVLHCLYFLWINKHGFGLILLWILFRFAWIWTFLSTARADGWEPRNYETRYVCSRMVPEVVKREKEESE